jgi:26S proteasome regulatory subunit N2
VSAPHPPIVIIPHQPSSLDRESFYESTELPNEARDFAALLASKVYYFLGEYDESLSFALGAGKPLRRKHTSKGWRSMWRPLSVSIPLRCAELEFPAHFVLVHTAKAIDRYIHLRADAQPNGTSEIDLRLSAIIETIFNRCIADGEYQQVRTSSMNS